MNLSQYIAIEHIHPLVAHFPVVLCLVGSLFYWISFLVTFRWLEQAALAMGFVGVGLGFLAQYTGKKAAAIVGPTLCKPTVMAQHVQETESAVIFYAVTFAVGILLYFARTRFFPHLLGLKWVKVAISLGLILGTIFMAMGAYRGFELVYFMGAGVKSPSTLCVP